MELVSAQQESHKSLRASPPRTWGVIGRSDRTDQVTFHGRPLYLYCAEKEILGRRRGPPQTAGNRRHQMIGNFSTTGSGSAEPTPPGGLRVEVAFEGPMIRGLSGMVVGVDCLTLRADGRIDLDPRADITTDDGEKIALPQLGWNPTTRCTGRIAAGERHADDGERALLVVTPFQI